jgi:hypothetical protein
MVLRPFVLALVLPGHALQAGDAGTQARGLSLAQESQSMSPDQTLPPPRYTAADSARLAFDEAAAASTSAALILFLAREPDSPYRDEARALLDARRTPDPPGTAAAVAPADAGIIEAFDAARLAGSATAWERFLAAHGTHPLAAEARRLMGR